MQGTAREVRLNSKATFPYELLHMIAPVLADLHTYIQRLCMDSGYSLEDLPGVMVNRNE